MARTHNNNSFSMALVATAIFAIVPTAAEAQRIPADSLADLSLEQLANIRVTSVSRTEEDLSTAAAAVAVVTADDIHRSGATTVPEVLRTVPGIHVARQNASGWAVSSRGFSNSNSRNLLVLSDSRSIYTPLVSGVFWDVQDFLMEDIDRIEVIRGPGASLWGSNAVNGVINITTKNARDTQGTYTEALAGTEQYGAAARYGGRTADDMYYRVFVKHSAHDNSYAPDTQSDDDWQMSHLGFRTDWEASHTDSFTVQGDLYAGEIGQLEPGIRVIGIPGPQGDLEVDTNGGNLLARWKHRIDDHSDFQLRAYYDRTYRDDPSFEDTLDTFDIDFQHRFAIGARHELLWGLNYRFSSNENISKGIFAVEPESADDDLVSLFVQDQIRLHETLQLTLGTKLEHNDFSGTEVQPNARLAWNLAPRHTVWTAVSRAVRVPTRFERDVAVNAQYTELDGRPAIVRLVGNEDFDSEEMVAYEVGYRWQASSSLFLDLAAFHNRYDGLSSVEFGQQPFLDDSGTVIVPITAKNVGEGRAQGFEALINYSPLSNWQLTTTYSLLNLNIDNDGQGINNDEAIEGSTPRHQVSLRSSLDWRRYQFDVLLRHHSRIRSIPEIRTDEDIPAYTEMDIRLARQLGRDWEISLVGRNLLDSQHPEFGAPGVRGEVERSVYAKVAVHF